jgi:pyruvate/2-oxoglutarate dehydrogenase complex dihydrolipoamide dehydrogenase (E3) component
MNDYDIIIIGAGSSLLIAQELTEKNKKVALFEKNLFGGTCLNRGCIPSKRLIYLSKLVKEASNTFEGCLHLSKFYETYKEYVEEMQQGIRKKAVQLEQFYKESNIDVIPYEASFIAPYTIKAGNQLYRGKKIILNLGSKPFIPQIEGLDKVPFLTSDEALQMTHIPRSLAIIGGGYIGIELACHFAALGTQVTIFEKDKILSLLDLDIIENFKSQIENEIAIFEEIEVNQVSYTNKKFSINVKKDNKKQIYKYDSLLVAAGRMPNTDSLELQKTKVKVNKKGYIVTNDYLETSQKHIWAFGDCIHGLQLKYLSNFEAKYITQSLQKSKKTKIVYPSVPIAIFSNPSIAMVGYGEKKLKKKAAKYRVQRAAYQETGKGWITGKKGLIKLIFDLNSRLIGAAIVGKLAEELIHFLSLCFSQKMTKKQMKENLFIHPTFSEIIAYALEEK